jgi:uncharacterized membrane protein HdeD (DUF308 family)
MEALRRRGNIEVPEATFVIPTWRVCRVCWRVELMRGPPPALRGARSWAPPGVGLLSMVWLVGLYALAAGLAQIVLALRLWGLRRREGRGVA